MMVGGIATAASRLPRAAPVLLLTRFAVSGLAAVVSAHAQEQAHCCTTRVTVQKSDRLTLKGLRGCNKRTDFMAENAKIVHSNGYGVVTISSAAGTCLLDDYGG